MKVSRKHLGPAAQAYYDQQKALMAPNAAVSAEISTRTKKAHRDNSVDQLEFLNILEKAGLPRPEVEYRFNSERMWRFDFCWPRHKLAMEKDGGIFLPGGGRHNRGGTVRLDNEKLNCAATMGYRILKVFPEKLLTVDTIEMVRSALNMSKRLL